MMSYALVICLGNPLRGDDAFGLLVYRLLRKIRIPAVYAGTAPENITRILRRVRPETVIIVDALAGAGEGLAILKLSDELVSRSFSSHLLPLRLLFESVGLDPSRVLVIGAGAMDLSLGSQPSERVRGLAVEAASLIARILGRQNSPRELKLGDEVSLLSGNVENPTFS